MSDRQALGPQSPTDGLGAPGASASSASPREREARTHAERAEPMNDEFVAVLAHELRSPLNAILNWTHVLLRRGGNDELVQGLRAILRNGEAQADMIAHLQDHARLSAGRMGLAREPVDPLVFVRQAVDALAAAAQDNGNEVVVQAATPVPQVLGDGARLQQVMHNLIGNAIKASPRGARIDVVLSAQRGGVAIEVHDHGHGIAPQSLALLFDGFRPRDPAQPRFRRGLGLGLSIVRHLVRAHGGEVQASSEGPGRGATFEVWLPALPAPGDGGAPGDERPPQLVRTIVGLLGNQDHPAAPGTEGQQ